MILQKVLADKVNRGYHNLQSLRISKVQGRPVGKLSDLVRAVDSAEGEFVVFEARDRQLIVIDRELAANRAETILHRYGVPGDRSANLKAKRRK